MQAMTGYSICVLGQPTQVMRGPKLNPLFTASYIGKEYFIKTQSLIERRYQQKRLPVHVFHQEYYESLYLIKGGVVHLIPEHEVDGPFSSEFVQASVSFHHERPEGLAHLLIEFSLPLNDIFEKLVES